jgi:hypothetical protein
MLFRNKFGVDPLQNHSLKTAIINLGGTVDTRLAREARTPQKLQKSAIIVARQLIKSNPTTDISRFATGILLQLKKRMQIPVTTLDNNKKMKNFFEIFVKHVFFSDKLRIKNVELFRDIFKISKIRNMRTIIDNKKLGSATTHQLFRVATQRQPLISKNLNKLREMIERNNKTNTHNEIKSFLTPTNNRFNPLMSHVDSSRAEIFAVELVRLYASKKNENIAKKTRDCQEYRQRKLLIATLVLALMKNRTFTNNLLSKIQNALVLTKTT